VGIDLYAMASCESPRLAVGGAKFSDSFKLRQTLNLGVITSSRYGELEVARDVGLYRKRFSLGRKTSARGRSIARSKKISKIFFS
jgi:hypothetical protein